MYHVRRAKPALRLSTKGLPCLIWAPCDYLLLALPPVHARYESNFRQRNSQLKAPSLKELERQTRRIGQEQSDLNSHAIPDGLKPTLRRAIRAAGDARKGGFLSESLTDERLEDICQRFGAYEIGSRKSSGLESYCQGMLCDN
jgi:hypothetical protein